jgi:hypothetical protein
METSIIPWIETGVEPLRFSLKARVDETELHHALFAARVLLKPFAQVENFNWGFSNESLLLSAMERQSLFIESQHPHDDFAITEPQDRRTLALRCIRDPSSDKLQLTILGKISSDNCDIARSLALEYWHEINSIFPYEYVLDPAKTQTDFLTASGLSLLEDLTQKSILEINRFEGALADGATLLYILGKWNATTTSNEQIWRVIAGCKQPMMLNITLQPTTLFDHEIMAISEMIKTAKGIMENKPFPIVLREAEWAYKEYSDRLARLRHPFLAQVLLVGHGKLPTYIPRVIGSALAHNSNEGPAEHLYQISQDINGDAASAQSWIQSIRWLEPSVSPSLSDTRLTRMRYLVNRLEASSLFRLPFPSKGGLPGVHFQLASTPDL